MKAGRNTAFRVFVAVCALAFCTCLAAGCEGIGHLRKAQDDFNAAARLDLSMHYENPLACYDTRQFADIMAKRTEARDLYASALNHLDMISPSEEAGLKKNGLYGTVLILKALCYWKLKDYERALDVKSEADTLDDRQLIPRDRQIFRLLTALIAIDEALPVIEQMSGKDINTKEKGLRQVKVILFGNEPQDRDNTLSTINSVLDEEGLDNHMKIYAQQLKLMALKRYLDAYQVCYLTCAPQDDVYRREAVETLRELQKTAGGQSGQVAGELIRTWTAKLGCGITAGNQ